MSTAGSDKTQETLYAVGSDMGKGREATRADDTWGTRVVHRFDKVSFRSDIGRMECSCDGCRCGDTTVCIGKKCGCCTIS